MNLSELCIRRPVMTILLTAALVLGGLAAYRQLPVAALPRVDFPVINVSATLPGASPETMAASVASPLEREFSTIAGIDTITSTSSLGNTSITIQFVLERDIDAAAQDVQAAIARTQRRLPAEMTTAPSYRKVNPADQPVLMLALSSPTLPLSALLPHAFGPDNLHEPLHPPALPPPANPPPPPARPPTGNVVMASTRACRNQAYKFKNRIFGFQFHVELERPDIDRIIDVRSKEATLAADQIATMKADTEKQYDRYDRLSTKLLTNLVQFLKVY